VLARLWERKGDRFAALWRGLGASPGAISDALDALIALGLVMRNPGYGHPLRPEYVLAAGADETGRMAHALDARISDGPIAQVLRDKWSVPILAALTVGEQRYGALRRLLTGITDRALSASLRALEAEGLVVRTIAPTYPPSAGYGSTAIGREIGAAAAGLEAAGSRISRPG